MKTITGIDISPPVIYLLELWAEMLLANQTAGFFKMWYLKEEVNDEVYFWHAEKQQNFL